MNSLRSFTLVVLCGIFCAGCVDVEKIVTLNADGSGTLVETVLMKKQMFDDLEKSSKTPPEPGQEKTTYTWLDEDKLRQRATKMGEGVTFVSAQRVRNETHEGWIATYAFTDVERFELDRSPLTLAPQFAIGDSKPSTVEPNPIRFKFRRGTPAEVIVDLSEPDRSKNAEKPMTLNPGPGGEGSLGELLGKFMEDGRIAIAIDVPARIVETDARFHEGRRITLMDLSFNKIRGDAERMKKLGAELNRDPFDRRLFEGAEGVKVDLNNIFKIRFE